MGKSSELVGIPLIIRACMVECSHSFLIFVSYNSELAAGFQPMFHAVWNIEESWETWPITNLVLKWAVIKGPRLDGLYKGSYKALIRIPIKPTRISWFMSAKKSHPQSPTTTVASHFLHRNPGGNVTGWFRNGKKQWKSCAESTGWMEFIDFNMELDLSSFRRNMDLRTWGTFLCFPKVF